jgi:hypothetical protein
MAHPQRWLNSSLEDISEENVSAITEMKPVCKQVG